MSVNETLVLAYSVFMDHLFGITLSFVVFTAVSAAVRHYIHTSIGRMAQIVTVIAFLVAAFPIINLWAQQTAFRDVETAARSAHPQRRLVLRFRPSAAKTYSAALVKASKRGCLALIAQDANSYFVLVKSAQQRRPPDVFVAEIPIVDVSYFTVPLTRESQHADNCFSY